jgi:hypothetical protein
MSFNDIGNKYMRGQDSKKMPKLLLTGTLITKFRQLGGVLNSPGPNDKGFAPGPH